MPDVIKLSDVLPAHTIVTRDANDDADCIEWDLHISWQDEARLASCVEFRFHQETREHSLKVDLVRVAEIGLGCVTGWRGVTNNGTPVPFSVEMFAAIPRIHQQRFIDALGTFAIQRSFPAVYLPGGSTGSGESTATQ